MTMVRGILHSVADKTHRKMLGIQGESQMLALTCTGDDRLVG